jgi:hypothetical protein
VVGTMLLLLLFFKAGIKRSPGRPWWKCHF